MRGILLFFDQVIIQFFIYLIVAGAVMSWLLAFNVINGQNNVVRTIWNAINAITEPLLNPIRRLMSRLLPNLRGIDLSPMVLIFALLFLRYIIEYELLPRV
ncbi:MAG: YggT family protein [Hyphomicrobiaceae bacterium]